MKTDFDADILIIGAGPAGSLAASLLSQMGHSVKIFEYAKFPRFSIGESLLPQSMTFLQKAGVMQEIEKAGFQLKNGATFCVGADYSKIDFSNSFTNGPCETFEVKRAEFDLILANHAEACGADISYGVSVVAFDEDDHGVNLTVKDEKGDVFYSKGRFVLDASGFGRVLPRLLDLNKPTDFPVRKAIFSHIKDKIDHISYDRNKILITIADHNPDIWFWLIPFSDGTSSIGVVGEPGVLDTFGSTDEERLQFLIAKDENFQKIMPDFQFVRNIGQMIGYSSSVKSLYGDKFALLGNSGEFLDPIFSSGLTIAFKSADLAATLVDKTLKGEAVDWQKDFSDELMIGVNAFKAFVESWYEGVLQDVIMNQPEENTELKRMINSLLAGYAWDKNNKFVQHGKRLLSLVREMR